MGRVFWPFCVAIALAYVGGVLDAGRLSPRSEADHLFEQESYTFLIFEAPGNPSRVLFGVPDVTPSFEAFPVLTDVVGASMASSAKDGPTLCLRDIARSPSGDDSGPARRRDEVLCGSRAPPGPAPPSVVV